MSSTCEPNIVPVEYYKRGEYGDFEYMIKDDEYENSLFIFNDNVQDHCTNRKGAGNAVIRPYNKYGLEYPRSAGIPTGYRRERNGGFKTLTPEVKEIIDSAIQEIRELAAEHGYDTIYFSADPPVGKNRPLLGTRIFIIGDDVKQYITDQIYSLGDYEPVEDL